MISRFSQTEAIGVSTYSYVYRRSTERQNSMTLADILYDASVMGVDVVQICDATEFDESSVKDLRTLKSYADDAGIVLETGTKGVSAAHLQDHLAKAVALDAKLIRSMVGRPGEPVDLIKAEVELRRCLRSFADAGVTLGLETYEQVGTSELVALIENIGSESLGICVDVSNVVARLEMPAEVVSAAAPYTVNVHVKDFRFVRHTNMAGFSLEGANLGEGLLDFDGLTQVLRDHGRHVTYVVEHWLQPAGTLNETCKVESEWTQSSVRYLQRKLGVSSSRLLSR